MADNKKGFGVKNFNFINNNAISFIEKNIDKIKFSGYYIWVDCTWRSGRVLIAGSLNYRPIIKEENYD